MKIIRTLTEHNPRRFTAAFAGLLVFMLTSVAILNFIVNPMAQFPTSYYKPMAQTSRSQKLELFDQFEQRPAGLILGSSRVTKLEPEYLEQLTGRKFFNAGVNYGKPEDYLAWLRLYHQRYDCWPELVIVGIDPSSFSENMPPDARLINNREMANLVPEAISWSDKAKLWEDLFSWDHTKQSVKSLALQTLGRELPEPVEHYRHDGLLVYDVREREISMGTYDLDSGIEFNKNEYFPRYLNFGKHSLNRQFMFRDLAKTCEQNGTRLLVYITPMHPELKKHLLAKTEYLKHRDETAAFLTFLSKKFNYEFFDFANLESFDGDPQQFVDGTHPLESNTRRILDIMFVREKLASQRQAIGDRITASLTAE